MQAGEGSIDPLQGRFGFGQVALLFQLADLLHGQEVGTGARHHGIVTIGQRLQLALAIVIRALHSLSLHDQLFVYFTLLFIELVSQRDALFSCLVQSVDLIQLLLGGGAPVVGPRQQGVAFLLQLQRIRSQSHFLLLQVDEVFHVDRLLRVRPARCVDGLKLIKPVVDFLFLRLRQGGRGLRQLRLGLRQVRGGAR